MAKTSAPPAWETQAYMAFPVPIPIWLSVSLMDKIPGMIRMHTEPFADVGLDPWEARELARVLTEFADAAEKAADDADEARVAAARH